VKILDLKRGQRVFFGHSESGGNLARWTVTYVDPRSGAFSLERPTTIHLPPEAAALVLEDVGQDMLGARTQMLLQLHPEASSVESARTSQD
jgi:hypothetical protein